MNKVSKNIVIRLFNMVEVTLAIAVVGIGVAGIMSLFPVAVSSNRDAIADNYAGDITDQVMTYVSALAEKQSATPSTSDWTNNFINNIPDTAPSDSALAPGSTGSQILGNLYSGGTTGVFKVLLKSSSVTDFSAYAKVWRVKLPPVYVGGETAPEGWDNYNVGAGVHIEISYPAEIPYAQRKKINYYFEVYNPNPSF